MVKRRKTPGAGGKTPSDSRDERSPAGGDDVLIARDRLKGILQRQGRRDPGDDSSESGHDENRTSDTPSQPAPKRTVHPARKRRRTDANQEVAFHHTYVMKLFDRSVDLAQFRENTPLYPICRAWMANQPCAAMKDEPIEPKPEPEEEPECDDEKNDGEQNDSANDNELSSDPDSELVKITHKMPPPTPSDDSMPRHPKFEAEVTEALTNLKFDDPQAPSRDALLQEHLQKWANIRSEWIASCIRNEDRYAQSGRILRAIYRRAQKAFE